LVLTKQIMNKSGNYNVLPYNYDQSHLTMTFVPAFHVEIGYLTRSRRFFTPEELENQRKVKGKYVVDLIRTYEVNKLVGKEYNIVD